MKPENSFDVDFNYPLSEDLMPLLTATVQLHHSNPHYLVTNFHFKKNECGSALLPDINIMAIKTETGAKWVHTDSKKETRLSIAVGRAIEARGDVEFANP